MVLLELIASVATLLLTVVFARWEGLRLQDVGVTPSHRSLPRFVLGTFIGLLMVALHTLLIGSMGHIRWVRSPGPVFSPLAVSVLAFLTLAFREEPAFHGYPLRSLDRAIGPWSAQLIIAFVFAVEHVAGGMTWLQAFWGAAVGSLFFGLVALTTRGLAMSIGLHGAWDFAQWLLGYKDFSGLWHPIIEKGFEHRVEQIGMISYLLVMGSAIFGVCGYRMLRPKGFAFGKGQLDV